MAEASKNCVDAAIAYAEGKEHDGKGYHLRVTLENGTVVEGAVSRMDGQHPNVLFLLVNNDFGKPAEVFVDKSRAVMASVV